MTTQGRGAIKAIAAMASNRVIGVQNSLPWHIPEDLKRFKTLTTGNAVLMGRKTYESFPAKFRPLPNRLNIVLSRTWKQEDVPEGVLLIQDLQAFIAAYRAGAEHRVTGDLWILGGQTVYEATVPLWDEVHLTRIEKEYEGDAYFPEFESVFKRLAVEQRDGYSFEHYVRS